MTARIGIELSPLACRIVEIDGQPAWARRPRETRVRSFAVLPPSGLDTRATLQSLRRRTAAVVVWNVASEHRQVVVTGGSYELMRAEALAALAGGGLETRGVVADIAPVGPPARGVRQPVVVAIASALDVSAALQPLRDAGIRLRTVTTPAVALGSLARARRAYSVPGAIEAYVALEETATCIALVRDSVLVAALELPWGFAENTSGEARPRDEIAARLADSVTEFVAAIGGEPREIGQVCVCGGLPELRSMTLPLMERLDVEVEPLDSMFGIDAAHVPEPADEFRERSVELRLAWAAAADWPPPINLLRAQRRRASKTMLARGAVAAGVVAGLAVGWRVERSAWWRSTASAPQTRTATNALPRGRAASPALRVTPPVGAQSQSRVVAPPPDVGPNLPPVVTPPAVVGQNKPPVVGPSPDIGPKLPPVVVPSPAAAQNKSSVATSPPAMAQNKPASVAPSLQEPPRSGGSSPRGTPVMPSPVTPAATRPPAAPRPAPLAARAGPPPTQTAPAAPLRAERVPRSVEPPPVPTGQPVGRIEPPPARAAPPAPIEPARARTEPIAPRAAAPSARAKPVPQEVPLPFDAVLGTILYAPDRKLAIIDGRIVGPGDEVRGARVTDITPTAVLLRDAQGRLRRLTVASGGLYEY